MASLSLPTPAEGAFREPLSPVSGERGAKTVLVVGCGDPAAADYTAFVRGRGGRTVEDADVGDEPVSSVVLFVGARLSRTDRKRLASLFALPALRTATFVCVVASHRVHLDDRDAVEA